MVKIISILKRGFLASSVILLAGGFTPTAIFADAASTAPATCAIPLPTGPGVHQPVGADAGAYTYNCDTGLWQSAYYTYNPNTGVVTPTYSIVYTYDPSTGRYDTTAWVFDAASGRYVTSTQSVAQPPAGADVVGGPTLAATSGTADPDSSSINGTGPGSNNTINDNGGVGSGSISNTGPSSNNSLGGSSTNDLNDNNTNNLSANNLITQQADTGDSLVLGNTTAGDATSGDAQDIANVVNLLQSSSNALGGNTVTFVANINGDVNGDLLLDPSSLGTVQPASTGDPIGTPGTNNLTVDNSTNAAINNNIGLDADSGNATVADNTTGGNATSGSAEAIANVVNLIDSAISGGQSFVGVININGDFNGDILMPPDFINQLIASNVPTVNISDTGPGSNNTINTNDNSNNTKVTNTNNEGITNNVNATAASGQAAVTDNTSAGNATSGNASTNITAFNLTGSNVIGANDLLVFVNVLGTWVGMIVNAPAGATAAELGGGITQATQNGSNNNTTVNNTANQQINNNINENSQSGNATVADNTKGGNATSGNANNAVNLLNVENSNLSLSGWFGILFINVFGTWNGNFGVANAADYHAGSTSGGSGSGSSGSNGATVPATMQVFRFIPSGSGGSGNGGGSSGSVSTGGSSGSFADSSAVLAAAHLASTAKNGAPTPKLQSSSANLWLPLSGIGLFALYAIGDVFHSRRSRGAKSV